ncbi:MAG: hypothetical protein HOV80_19050 [Polyangiaceae bacterium]|nr:hypothetical protein [Polyangiaceae bacterium]
MLIPEIPDDVEWGEAEVPSRFEDVAQDGRIQLGAMLHGLGRTNWRRLMKQPGSKELMSQGVVPILTRLVVHGYDGPFAVDPNPQARGAFAFSHVPAETGGAERILVGMWLEVRAPIGAVYGAPPDRAGEVVVAGRVYAEHTLTRPFASPGERRVTKIDAPGLDAVPGRATARVLPTDVAKLPAGATKLDPDPVAEPSSFVFGMMHTDWNQHVNSLVYLRLFEEAALRRMKAHGHSGPLLARRAEIAYAKPSFAGDAVRVSVQAYEHEGKLGATGAFVPEGGAAEKPTCFVHLGF